MRRKGTWSGMVLTGFITLSLVSVLLPVKGQAISETVTFDFLEQQEPTAYIGNAAIQSGLTRVLTASRFAQLQFVIHSSDLFTINSTTGALSTKQTIDREEVCPNQKECKLTFDITVYELDKSGNFDLYRVLKCILRITDINDNSPTFPHDSVSLSIDEKNKPDEVLRTSAAVDKDKTDEYSIQQYRFKEPSELFSLQVIDNPDGSSYLGIQVKEELDREERDFYQVTVIATDGGFPRRSGSVLINITVTDINDNVPKFLKSSYNESVPENFRFHVPIMKVEAVDKDAGRSAEISYRFSSQVSDSVRDVLYIDEQTGEILAHAKIDYEKVKLFQFVVEAVDHGDPPAKSRVAVRLHVIDVNDNPPQININLSPEGTSISELEPIGKFIAHVSVLDKDEGINGDVLCEMDDAHFSLEKFDGFESNMYKVVLETSLDHEQSGTHRITITCTDSGHPPLSNSTGFVVTVVDENDNRPAFTEPVYYGDILENKIGEHSVVTVVAHDWDSGDFGRVSYSIEDKYNGLFVINSTTGVISVWGPLDRESKSTYEFHVIARDRSPDGLSSSSLVIVTVKDDNDEAPRFPNPVYFGEILENEPTGTTVGNVTAEDPDDAENSKFRYSIIADGTKDSGSFSIDPSSGVIKSRTVFNREEKSQYHFVVKVTDPSKPMFTSTCNFTVRIMDDNDHAPVIDKYNGENLNFTVQYSSAVGTLITTILAYDGDAATSINSQLIFLIEKGDSEQLFNLNRYTGSLSLARMVAAKDARRYNLIIRVEDGGSPPLFDKKELIIKINGTAPPVSASTGLDQNILIVIILIGITLVLGLAILAAICLIKKIDRERRANRDSQKKMEDKMYHMKQDDVFTHVPVESSDDSNNASNNLNKRAKKEVSFSFDEESDSHNTSTGSGHPLTSFRVGGDRNKPNGCHLIEILKKSAEDALSESSGETDPSDSGRGGSEDDSSHRGSGLDPEHTTNGLYPKIHTRGCHDNEAYHPHHHHHQNHLHPQMAPGRYSSLGKGRSARHQTTSGPFISPRDSLSSDIESDMSLTTGSRTSQSRSDSERSTNPILPPMSFRTDSSSPRSQPANTTFAPTAPRSRDSTNGRRGQALQRDSPHRLTSPYHHSNSSPRSFQGQGQPGTFYNSIPLASMSTDRLNYGSSASDRSRSTTPSERSAGTGGGQQHHWFVPSSLPEEDDRTTTSGSYTINPDELRQEIDQLILQDSIV